MKIDDFYHLGGQIELFRIMVLNWFVAILYFENSDARLKYLILTFKKFTSSEERLRGH